MRAMSLGSWIACVLFALAQVARAQLSPVQVSEATQLFEAAQTLMKNGQYEAACERFEQSQRLDPQLGTLLHLANCEESSGRTASAHRDFSAAAQLAAARRLSGKPDAREDVALRRAERLKPQLAYVLVSLSADVPPEQQISLDSQPLPAAFLNDFTAIDPGAHTLLVQAPLHRAWSHTLLVEPATRVTLPVPALEAEPAPAPLTAASAVAPPAAASGEPAAVSLSPEPARTGGTQRIAAYVLGGGALVGLGVAAYFGTRAKHYQSLRDDVCPDDPCTLSPQAAVRARSLDERANNYASAFNWTGALSLAVLSVGVVLYVTGGEREPASARARLSVGWGSVQVRGAL